MAEFTQDILEFLQRNHLTDSLAALQSELANQKSLNGSGFFNYSSCLSPQGNGRGSNENHGGEQRTKSRDDESMDIKSFQPNDLTSYITFEKRITRPLKDENDCEAENLEFPCSSSKVVSNQQMDSEFKARELESDSSNHVPYTEHRDANSEGTLYENDQKPISMNDYTDGALDQCKTSYEQRNLQDSSVTSEEIHMLCKGHAQFGNRIDYSFAGDPNLGLSRISIEKTKIVKELGDNMIEAKGNFHETQDEEILMQDMPEEQYLPRKLHSRGNLWDQIETNSQPDGKNPVLKEVDLDLRSHGRDYNLFIHDKKTSGPQIGNDILDLEPNNKSHFKFDQGKGGFVQEAVPAHEIAEKIPYVQECFAEKTGYRSNIGPLKEVPLKTAFPFSINEVFVNSEQLLHSRALGKVAWVGSEGTVQGESKGLMTPDQGHDREGLPAQMLNSQGSLKQKKVESLNLLASIGSSNELFPSFSSKTFQVADYGNNNTKEDFYGGSRMDPIASRTEPEDMESSVLLGSYIHIPVEREITNTGEKLAVGSRQPSNYRTAQGDSGIFGNDNKQPTENDSWLFSNEIYYPPENEEWRSWDREATNNKKNEHDNQILAENLYFPRKQHLQSNNELKVLSQSPSGSPMTYNYNGKLISNHETDLLQIGPECQGFSQQRSGVEILGDVNITHQSKVNNFSFVDHHELMRSGVGICGYEDADFNVRRNCVTGITESLSLNGKPVKYDRSGSSDNSIDRAEEFKKRQEVVDYQVVRYDSDSNRHHRAVHDSKSGESDTEKHFIEDSVKERSDGLGSQIPYDHSLYVRGFSFPSFSTVGDVAEFKEEPEKSFLSDKRNMVFFNGKKYSSHNISGPSDIQIASGWKSKASLPVCSVREGNVDELHTMQSVICTHFNNEDVQRIGIKRKDGESLNDLMKDEVTERVEDEEAASIGQLIQQIKAQQDQFETFDLQIVHRKNRTGYEEVKDYHAILNTVIAGRYHVIQNLGSAVFSNVVQVHDLHTGMDLCLKIIKNNKEYFDQCLDEIKLLKLVNKHDPADKYHLLRLHNYFYYHEHLFIVCELLKANLYEFYKFNRESGGEAYFTMPRLQSIAIQCLEALQFLHNLGLIHCDLKPENILMKSYSRCEVKVIDLGSSCFVTDYLCSTVQSRSYRAPEVILGLPYDNRIDIWSLGCILPELFLGNVLFQSDSSATLLASIISVVGPIDEEMLVMGFETHKYFTKSYTLYEQNQDTNGIEFLTPKRTTLQNVLQMGDQGFIDFVTYLLEINPKKRPTATAALQHPWLSYSYGPISS